MGLRLLLGFALQLLLPLRPRLMLVSCMEPMDLVLVLAMLVLAMELVLDMLVMAMEMVLDMPVLDMELDLAMLVLAMVLVSAMLVLLPPLLPDTVSPMLPSVRLRLSQRLKLMLVFCMEDMDMVVLDILD